MATSAFASPRAAALMITGLALAACGGGGAAVTTPREEAAFATVATPGASFSPATVTIAAGGTVRWEISGATHNVTFQGAAPPGGNVPDTRAGAVSRAFPAAGSFPYTCTRHSGMAGRVVVQ